jgi:hypothetical protein
VVRMVKKFKKKASNYALGKIIKKNWVFTNAVLENLCGGHS